MNFICGSSEFTLFTSHHWLWLTCWAGQGNFFVLTVGDSSPWSWSSLAWVTLPLVYGVGLAVAWLVTSPMACRRESGFRSAAGDNSLGFKGESASASAVGGSYTL